MFPDDGWDPANLVTAILAQYLARPDCMAELEPPPANDLQDDITALFNFIAQRPGRIAEIEGQSVSIEPYFNTMLMLRPGSKLWTRVLIAAGIEIGHAVGMHWKLVHKRARPVQVAPLLMPVLPTPGHASYPNNHALQSMLIAMSLAAIFDGTDLAASMASQLGALAARIGENREIAGLHWPSDTDASDTLAPLVFARMQQTEAFRSALAKAREEWNLGSLSKGPALPAKA